MGFIYFLEVKKNFLFDSHELAVSCIKGKSNDDVKACQNLEVHFVTGFL